MAIYGLNYLGWITVFFVFISILIFLWLLVFDLKNKNYKLLINRVIVLVLVLTICIISNYYDHKRNENITKEELKEIFGN